MKNILFIFLILFISCAEKTHFTKNDKYWINKYNLNDTLIFKNERKGITKTFVISNKKKFHSKREVMISNWRTHKSNTYIILNGRENVFIGFSKGKKNRLPGLNFLGAYFNMNEYEMLDSLLLKISNKYFENLYKFESIHEKNDFSAHTLFWDKEFGLIKYIAFGDNVFERINF